MADYIHSISRLETRISTRRFPKWSWVKVISFQNQFSLSLSLTIFFVYTVYLLRRYVLNILDKSIVSSGIRV